MAHRPDAGVHGDDDPELAEVRAARARFGRDLVEAAVAALPAWIDRCVTARRPTAAPAGRVDALVAEAATAAVRDARSGLAEAVARVPGRDRGATPLEVLRSLVRHPTAVLRALGAPEVERGQFETRAFPEDVYDLSPATWADLDPRLHEPGLGWGAATARLHALEHRAPGR